MLKLKNIRALNIEISSICNANCPFCSRKQKRRHYPDQLLTIEDMQRLPPDFIAQLRRISFGGNFGDLCCNPEMPGIAAHIRHLNAAVTLEGDTNGSFQKSDWWRSLGPPFKKGAMVFSIDGLRDTHRLHRRGTDFDTIIRNAGAFIQGGGTAYWKFIAFRHNEHQIDDAEELAEKIGCTRFYAVASRDFDHRLRPPEMPGFQIKRELFSTYAQQLEDDDRCAVCRPLDNRSLYIAADGTVHPCCFAHLMGITEHNDKFRFILPLLKTYGGRINFKTRPLKEIVEGPYFREVIEKSRFNAYCMTKCNKHRKQIRRDLVLRDRFFR